MYSLNEIFPEKSDCIDSFSILHTLYSNRNNRTLAWNELWCKSPSTVNENRFWRLVGTLSLKNLIEPCTTEYPDQSTFGFILTYQGLEFLDCKNNGEKNETNIS